MRRIDNGTLETVKRQLERITADRESRSGPGARMTVNPTLTGCHEARTPQSSALLDSPEAKLLRRLYERLGSWEKVGAKLGLNKGLLWSVAKGKITSPSVSAKLKGSYRQLWDEAR